MKKLCVLYGVVWAVSIQVGLAAAGYRIPVGFAQQWDVGLGRSVYVVGNHSSVGNWNPIDGQRLTWTPGNVWTGTIGLVAGTTLEYKFISRLNDRTVHCDEANVIWMAGPNLVTNVPAPPSTPYSGKTIYYHSNWTNAYILHRVGTNFVNVAMERLGEGRTPAESLYRVTGLGEPGELIEFVPNGMLGGQQYWDNALYPGYGNHNYATEYDVFFVQDKQVFNYRPADTVSPTQLIEMHIASTVNGLPGRRVRVWLPRGYAENEWKQYPVIILHDGQNVFQQGFVPGLPPVSWRVDESSEREISQGRMREVILVAVDNTLARLPEYCPPGDTVLGDAGVGNLYAQYIEADVLPTIQGAFRVLTSRSSTAIMGSSMGGLISSYIGLEASESFGAIGAMSPSFWAASNFVQRVGDMERQDVRLYLDGGTGEGDSIWQLWAVHDAMLRAGYTLHMDQWTVIDCGAGHNETAWEARFPEAVRFLLPVRDEANLLTYDEVPLSLEEVEISEGGITFRYPSFQGWRYVLEASLSLRDQVWTDVTATGQETMPWREAHILADQEQDAALYRLRATAF